ncbi:MAG: RIP metalloprotease RseP [Gammaproteobacteria bacterium]|nr:RIP metalloprotease RseP [Gammaproteobacteria bacterium]
MGDAFIYIGSFILALGILIAVHEYGHFWVARKLGVKVLRFSIGFGKPLLSRKSRDGETEYVLAAIPLGGYVKMLDEREGEVAEEELDRAFNNKPVLSRIAVVLAGPIANFIFAIFALSIMYFSGIPGYKPILGDIKVDSIAGQAGFRNGDLVLQVQRKDVASWQETRMALLDVALDQKWIEVKVQDAQGNQAIRTLNLNGSGNPVDNQDFMGEIGLDLWRPPAVLGEVTPGGPADQAGLKAGDRVISVNGEPMNYWLDWVNIVREHHDQLLQVEIDRQGELLLFNLTPGSKQKDEKKIGFVDVRMPQSYWEKMSVEIRYGPIEALGAGIGKTWDMSVLMLRVMGKIVTGDASLRNISGPVTIAQYAGDSASRGLMSFLSFLALISISLGVLNLLPIPILDGGHLMYYLVELVKGSPVSEQTQSVGQQIGIMILLALMILAFYNDFMRLLN